MTASELHRKLLYYGYDDVTDYLMNSPVHRYLYREFLDLLPAHKIEVSALKIFNEIYYQLIRIPLDRHPGEDIQRRYLEECTGWLGSPNAAELVFCIVVAFMKRKEKLSFQEECFLQQLLPLIDGSLYVSLAKELKDYMDGQCISVPSEYAPMPIPVKDIPKDLIYVIVKEGDWFTNSIKHALGMGGRSSGDFVNPWKQITYDFSYKMMEWYIKLYTTIEDQQELLNRIEKACADNEYKAHRNDFTKLRDCITAGEFIPIRQTIDSDDYLYNIEDYRERKPWTPRFESNDEAERVFNEEYAAAAEKFEESSQEKEELSALEKRIEEMQKLHNDELLELRSKYQSEIEELKRQLEEKSASTAMDENNESEEEFMLPVSEMVAIVKERFTEIGANEFYGMLSKLAVQHGHMSEEDWQMMDGIVPAVIQRGKLQQTIEIPYAGQVNIGPQKVINQAKEDEK